MRKKTRQATKLEVWQNTKLKELKQELKTAYLRGWKDGYETAKSDYERDGVVE